MLIVDLKMWRCSYDNRLIEDVSSAVIDARVTMDPENDQTWTMEAVLTWDGWRRLTPYLDWLAPIMTVTYPDGTVRSGQLGRYLVLDSPEEHTELSAKVKLECADPLWLVARSGVSNTLVLDVPERRGRKGMKKTALVRKILDSVVLTEDDSGKPLYAIPDKNETFQKDREWDPDTSKLEVANEVLHGVGLYPLWTTKQGVITTKAMGEARLRQRHPVRTYSANLPAGIVLLPSERPLGGLASEVGGVVNTTPKGQDFTSDILLINDDPDNSGPHQAGVRVRGRITHPNNPRARFRKNGRRKTKKLHNPVLDDDATAQEVADALLDELSTLNSTIRLEVTPDPVPEFARETVACLLYNAHGDEIAVGQYAVHRVEYKLAPPWTMVLSLGRVDDADDVIDQDVA